MRGLRGYGYHLDSCLLPSTATATSTAAVASTSTSMATVTAACIAGAAEVHLQF